MPNLNCSVSNCSNNAEGCCCLNSIDVSGGGTATNTCCSDFTDVPGASNAVGDPSPATNVSCQATDCAHNCNCQCNAESIDMAGMGACNCADTECSSFCHE